MQAITAAALSQAHGVRHGFFTRAGGVSQGIYASLNCGLGSKDDPAAVRENRARVARYLGANSETVLTAHQHHSASVVVAEAAWPAGSLPRADAIVTRTRGLAIGVLAADCAPVLFADGNAGIVGAAHAGWRGAFDGVVEETVAAMETLGAQRSRIRAAVGPCIGQAAYEVGPEFEERFLAADPENRAYFNRPRPEGRPHFALADFVMSRLSRLGLGEIENASNCTFANDSLFFSYRGSQRASHPDYGRQISAILVT